MVGRK